MYDGFGDKKTENIDPLPTSLVLIVHSTPPPSHDNFGTWNQITPILK